MRRGEEKGEKRKHFCPNPSQNKEASCRLLIQSGSIGFRSTMIKMAKSFHDFLRARGSEEHEFATRFLDGFVYL